LRRVDEEAEEAVRAEGRGSEARRQNEVGGGEEEEDDEDKMDPRNVKIVCQVLVGFVSTNKIQREAVYETLLMARRK